MTHVDWRLYNMSRKQNMECEGGKRDWEKGSEYVDQYRLPSGVRAILHNQQAVKKAIEEITRNVLHAGQGVRKLQGLVYRFVDQVEMRLIEEKTKIAISPKTMQMIDNYAIEHALNRHGGSPLEKLRGQVPITMADFGKVPGITRPENITETEKNKRGQLLIIYRKRYNRNDLCCGRSQKKKKSIGIHDNVEKEKRPGIDWRVVDLDGPPLPRPKRSVVPSRLLKFSVALIKNYVNDLLFIFIRRPESI